MALDSDIERRKSALDARADTILSILGSLFTSVELACLANGKAFTHPPDGQRAQNSFYIPLRGLKEILMCLEGDVERWTQPAKFLEYKSGALMRLCRSKTSPVPEKMRKLYKTLDKIGRIDDNYVYAITRFADDLDPVRQEIRKLTNFLRDICQEGNSLNPSEVAPRTPNSLRDITNEQQRPRNHRRSPEKSQDQDTEESLSQHLTETALVTPPSESDLTPHWKHVLSTWHPIQDLFVGVAEHCVFSEALHLAKQCAWHARSAQQLAREKAVEAEESKATWEGWWDVWYGWNEDRQRREKYDEEDY